MEYNANMDIKTISISQLQVPDTGEVHKVPEGSGPGSHPADLTINAKALQIMDDREDKEGGSPQEHHRPTLSAITLEVKCLAKLAWPVVLTQCLLYTIGTVSIIFAGHRGTLELDVVALSTAIFIVTGVSVANGFSGYCDTMFSQVYGSKDQKMLGVVLQRCILIMTLAICPCLAIQINILPILLLMGYDSTVARLSQQYLMIQIPGTIAAFMYIVLAKYVQNQNREIPILIVAFLANVVNAVLHAVCFNWLQTGVWGSALSQSLAYVSLTVFTLLYIMLSGIYKDTWQGWKSDNLLYWASYCKLGLFSLMQYCIETLAFYGSIIISGILGPEVVAAQSITFQFVCILYMFAVGIGQAGGIRIGQHLGANNAASARLSSIVTLCTIGMFGVIFCVLILSLRHQLPLIFTNERDIVELVTSVLPIIAVLEIFDCLAGTMNCILRASGRQDIGSAVTIPAFCFIIIAGMTVMLKTPLMLKGFWIVALCSLVFQSCAGTIFIICLNWQTEANKAQLRIKESKVSRDYSIVNPEFDIGELEQDTTGKTGLEIKSTPAEHITDTVEPQRIQVTKKIIVYRILAITLSIGCLIVGLIINTNIDTSIIDPAYTNSTQSMSNETTMGLETLMGEQ